MADYPTKYLFVAETRGLKQAATELNALAAAMSKMNASGGAAAAGGGASPFSPGKNAARDWDGLSGYVEKFGVRLRSALMYSLAFGVIGGTFGTIASGVRTWVGAQVQLNDVVSDSIILLNRSRDAAEEFANVQRGLAFRTGADLAEVSTSSMMAERVGQRNLATSAAEWSLVVGPQLKASETVDDLRALSIQFGLSMEQINNSMLAVMQNSGIAAGQLFDLSASFGVFSQQLGYGQTEEDMRKTGGLFAAILNMTGQSGPVVQNFVRRMANEFYDPASRLRKELSEVGVWTVTPGATTQKRDMFGNIETRTEEIRRPVDEIFQAIYNLGEAEIMRLSTAIDNSLGQPTQSQFVQVSKDWPLAQLKIDKAVDSLADFADAVDTASEKTSTGLKRIGIAITNLASVVGDSEGFNRFINNLGAGIQNMYDVLRNTDTGYMRFTEAGGRYNSVLEEKMFKAYGDNPIEQALERRLWEINRVLQVPVGLAPDQVNRFGESAVNQFLKSRYFDARDTGATGAQSFQNFYKSQSFDMAAALREAFAGQFSDKQIGVIYGGLLSAAEQASLGLEPLGEEARQVSENLSATGGPLQVFMDAISGGAEPARNLRNAFLDATRGSQEVEAAMGPMTNGLMFAEGELINLAIAAGGAGEALATFTGLKQFKLPEGYGLSDFARFYEEAGRIISRYDNPLIPYSEGTLGPVAITDDAGRPLGAPNYNPEQAGLALSLAQEDKRNRDKMLSDQKSYHDKALAEQKAYQDKMFNAWNGMIGDILKPSAVTGTDLFYNSQRGAYNDNWDEPVRQMRADINNALGGRPLEYGWGGLGQYMNMDAVMAAMGMDAESMNAILRSEEASIAERFYNMELPWEAYSGNTDAIIANAQAWIAGRQQKNANMANVQQLLIDAGLGPDAAAFVSAMEEPPILRQLFGGKSASEISTTVTDAVTPDLGKAIGEQVASVTWAMTISTAITNDVTNNYEMIVAAGRAIGKPLAEGSAQAIATAIIPLVIAAIVNTTVTP